MQDERLKQFPLAWRWTDPRSAQFLEGELYQLDPCSRDEASRLYDCSVRRFLGKDGLSPSLFHSILRRRADFPTAGASDWLRSLVPDLHQQVTLSWQPDTALRTSWELFTARWDDFCYPGSDDVLVWAKGEEWVLLYHHEEEFHLGFIKAG